MTEDRQSLHLPLTSVEATHRLARCMARLAFAPMCICLEGTLGAGKTEWTRGFAMARGVPASDITSPTFVLQNHYATQPPIVHMDVYRLHDEDDFLAIGAEEVLESPVITIIEWSQKVESVLPRERIRLTLEVVDATSRLAHLQAFGERHVQYLGELASAMQGGVELADP